MCRRQVGKPAGAFYFGSFRNNYVDNRPEKRYRELESFPGFEIDQITARKFGKLTGEVNLPPVRFAEIGTPAFFLSYARPALFGGTMLLRSPEKRSYQLFDAGRRSTWGSRSRCGCRWCFPSASAMVSATRTSTDEPSGWLR